MFRAEVRRSASSLDDSGLGVPTYRASLATSTPKQGVNFKFPVDQEVQTNLSGEGTLYMLDEASVQERITAIKKEYEEQIARHEERQKWLESVIDSARDIRKR